MKRPLAIAIRSAVVLLVTAFVLIWMARFRIATTLVDRKLGAAHVPASYRITRIGPFLERMENVRIGAPDRPDLLARRIDIGIVYGLSGPRVARVVVDGVIVNAVVDRTGLHLGVLDRLLPAASGGQTRLPDLDIEAHDTTLNLVTPNGALKAMLSGKGNPVQRFDGRAIVRASALRLASCDLRQTSADLAVIVRDGLPSVTGPIAIAATHCPDLTLSAGRADVTAASTATFTTVRLSAAVEGFGGIAGPARFAAVHGGIDAAGTLGALAVQARLRADDLALPLFAQRISQAAPMPATIPVAPTVRRMTQALAALAARSQAEARVDADIVGQSIAVRVRRASVTGSGGAHLDIVERGGLDWRAQGWRADGDLTLGGGDLPTARLALRQPAAGARLTGSGAIQPYTAGTARIAVPHLDFGWDGNATFGARLLVDGPLGDGFLRGLDVPVRGQVGANGLTIGQGCQPIAFQALRQGGFVLDRARIAVCGKPVFTRTASGATRIDATTGPIHLIGHSASGAPVALDAVRLRVTARGIEAEDLFAAIGASQLRVARLEGGLSAGGMAGGYTAAVGALANVPLLLSDADGRWSFSAGTLALAGKVRVADAAATPRFKPLTSDDMRMSLRGNRIEAGASLHEPVSHATIVDIRLAHDLADGTGYATLTVPGMNFAPRKLQPEALTPLTLGVIANVAGTVSGDGRIDWSPGGVTSSGTFGTDRLDLAAAFGPVSGIRGRIHFTDLLGLVSAPHQEVTIDEINPGVAVANGTVHFQLIRNNRVAIEDAVWPFASGQLRLDPTTLDFAAEAERHLTFRVEGLDAAAFVQQLDFPNIAATGRFDGVLPMIFDRQGGRIEGGFLAARAGGGTLAYVGELSTAQIGTMGKFAFDALKAIRYSALDIRFDGRLDGEMISQVRFTGIREATPDQSLVTRLIRNLPFRFNIRIRAPFRGLVGSARTYMDPRLLLNSLSPPAASAIQPPASGTMR